MCLISRGGKKSPTTGRICEPFPSWAGTLKQTSPVSVWRPACFYRALKCSASANPDMVNMLRAEVDRKKQGGRRGGSFLLMGDDSSNGAECSQSWNTQPAVRETSHGAENDTPSIQQEEPCKKRLTSASLLTHWEIKVQGVFFRWEQNISFLLATSEHISEWKGISRI